MYNDKRARYQAHPMSEDIFINKTMRLLEGVIFPVALVLSVLFIMLVVVGEML